jgi:ABC-type uncharacterized transport system permease subunit
MPPVRSLVSKRCTYIVALILLFSEIMPTCSYCVEKGLVYIAIIALFSCQLFFCFKYTKLNIYSFYNVWLVSKDKCVYYIYFNTL